MSARHRGTWSPSEALARWGAGMALSEPDAATRPSLTVSTDGGTPRGPAKLAVPGADRLKNVIVEHAAAGSAGALASTAAAAALATASDSSHWLGSSSDTSVTVRAGPMRIASVSQFHAVRLSEGPGLPEAAAAVLERSSGHSLGSLLVHGEAASLEIPSDVLYAVCASSVRALAACHDAGVTHGGISLDSMTVLRRGGLRLDGWDLGRAARTFPGRDVSDPVAHLARVGDAARHPSPEALEALVERESHLSQATHTAPASASWSSGDSSSSSYSPSGAVSCASYGSGGIPSRPGTPPTFGFGAGEMSFAPAAMSALQAEEKLHAADSFALGCTLLTLLTTSSDPSATSGRRSRRVVPPRLPRPAAPRWSVVGSADPQAFVADAPGRRGGSFSSESSMEDLRDATAPATSSAAASASSSSSSSSSTASSLTPPSSPGRGSAVWYLKHLRKVSLECRERLITSGVSGGGGLLELRGLVTALSHEDPALRLTPRQLMKDAAAYRGMVTRSIAQAGANGAAPSSPLAAAGSHADDDDPSGWPQWRRNAAAAMMAGLDSRRGPIATAWLHERLAEAPRGHLAAGGSHHAAEAPVGGGGAPTLARRPPFVSVGTPGQAGHAATHRQHPGTPMAAGYRA